MQLSHDNYQAAPSNSEFILICDHIQSPANMGSLFRLSDAFGVKEIIFCGSSPQITSGRLKRTARNTEKHVRFRESENITTTLHHLHENEYISVALEITNKSISIHRLHIPKEKTVLIIGNERTGIREEVLQLAHHHVHIDMFGKNSSMNVAQATAIAFYELTRI